MRILIIDGHPDPAPERYARALVSAYAEGARGAGHEIERIGIAELAIPPLAAAADWENGTPSKAAQRVQAAIAAADHLVIIYPLWLGNMPALLKAFFEQVFRPGFAITTGERTLRPGLLKNKSARVIVTMGMPALVYRVYFRAHTLRSLKRNILNFAGISPVRDTVIGSVEGMGDKGRKKWLDRLRRMGRRGR